jgi:hypothetical protein
MKRLLHHFFFSRPSLRLVLTEFVRLKTQYSPVITTATPGKTNISCMFGIRRNWLFRHDQVT